MARRIFAWYELMLERHPLTTKSLTGGILFSLGDVVTQKGKFT